MTTIPLKRVLSYNQEKWLVANVGPRLFYLHKQFGGVGWTVNQSGSNYSLTLEDDKKATMFILRWADSQW